MKRVRSILFECSCYRGERSFMRRKAIEEHVMERVEGACALESVTVREIDVGGGTVQISVELAYSKGKPGDLIAAVDRALLDVGVVALKALVSSVASRAVEAVVSGAAAGALAGGAAAATGRGARGGARTAAEVIAGALIGAAAGAAAEKAARCTLPSSVAVKQDGRWHVRRVPREA